MRSKGFRPDPEPDSPDGITGITPRERARRFASASFGAYGSNPGIKHFMSESGRTSMAYQSWGPVLVVLGGATGDPKEIFDLRRRFIEWAGHRPIVWYGRGVAENPDYDMLIGQEAIIRPATFTLAGKKMQTLRTAVNRAERAGMTLRTGSWPRLPRWVRNEILAVEKDWMSQHHLELGFSVSRFAAATGDDRPWMVATSSDGVEAYVTWLTSPDERGWILDLMRRRKDGISGAMDFLLVKSLEKAREDKLYWVSLGVAPAAEMDRQGAGRVAGLFNHGSLRNYKNKFRPEWHDRYLVLPRSRGARELGLMAVAAVHVTGKRGGRRRSGAEQRMDVPAVGLAPEPAS